MDCGLRYESHNIVCSTAHICNNLYGKYVHPNTLLKIKKAFQYLPDMDSTNIK